MGMRQKNSVLNTTRILLGCFFLAAVVLPLVRMFMRCRDADLQKIFSTPLVVRGMVNSVCVSLCATLLSVTLALLIAWCMSRTRVRLKGLFHTLLLLPMLIPSISHGMGLVILFGSNGKLTNRFHFLEGGLYGFWGIVIGSVMYSFPVAYLMISDVLKYEDFTPYEAASVLGIPPLHVFTGITLPYLRKPMVNVVFATFTMIVTDYGVPLMVGGTYKTLPVVMYEEVIGRLDFERGSVFGVILLAPAVVAFLVDRFCHSAVRSSFVSNPFQLKRSRLRDTAAYGVLIATVLAVVYPLASFMQLTFATRYPKDMHFTMHNVVSTIQKGALHYLGNSLSISLMAALAGTLIAFFCAYFTARVPSKSSAFLHLMSILSLAVPGIVLGLSYALSFKGTFLQGSAALLVLVNIVHFFSSPYLMIYNSFGKLNPNLEPVGATLGISRLRMIRDVLLPQTRETLLEMFSYFFVNSMMTISAVAFLATAKTKPISLMINQFEAQTLLEASAFVSLLILLSNLCVKGLIAVLRRRAARKRRNYAYKRTA